MTAAKPQGTTASVAGYALEDTATGVKIDVTGQLIIIAFEYFLCQGRVIPINQPKFRVTTDDRLEMLLSADSDLWVACNATETHEAPLHELVDDYTLGKIHSYAYVLKDQAGQWSTIVAFAPTKEQAEHDANLKLAEAFIDEVGEQQALKLMLNWIKQASKFLIKTRPTDPCPCGSGRKYRKCCGRVKP
jgi:hypothetical protein